MFTADSDSKRIVNLVSVLVSVCRTHFYKVLYFNSYEVEARGGIEPPIELLQSSALPLGDRAG